MPASLITVLILVLSAWLSIVSSKTPLYSKKKGIEIHDSGWQVIILLLLIAGCSLYQNKINDDVLTSQSNAAERKAKESEQRIRSDYAKTESQMRTDYQKGVESVTDRYESKTKELKEANDSVAKGIKHSYDSSTTKLVKALAEYGLTYNKRSDSVEQLIRSSRSPEPDFGLCDSSFSIGALGDTVRIAFNYCSYKATAENINSVCYVVWHWKNGAYQYAGAVDPLGTVKTVPMDKGIAAPMFVAKSLLDNVAQMFVVLKCTYTNKDGTKVFPNKKFIYSYDFILKKNGLSSNYYDQKIKEVLAQNNINL